MLEVVCSWAEAVVRVALGALIVFLGGGLFYEDDSSCAIAAFYLHNQRFGRGGVGMRARLRAWRGWIVGIAMVAGLTVVCFRAGAVVRVALGALALAYLAESAVGRLSGGAGRVGAALIAFLDGGLFMKTIPPVR